MASYANFGVKVAKDITFILYHCFGLCHLGLLQLHYKWFDFLGHPHTIHSIYVAINSQPILNFKIANSSTPTHIHPYNVSKCVVKIPQKLMVDWLMVKLGEGLCHPLGVFKGEKYRVTLCTPSGFMFNKIEPNLCSKALI